MITIIGAGNGGLAMAGYLEQKGIAAGLWNRSPERLLPIINDNNTIRIKDYAADTTKTIKVSKIFNTLGAAVEEAKYIVVITPSNAHEEVAVSLTPHLTKDHVIILMPGRTYGSVEFINAAQAKGGLTPVCFEAQTILHTCRAENNLVHLYATKPKVLFSTHGAKDSRDLDEIKKIWPELRYEDDYFSVTLNNIGAMLHPLPTILNAGRVDAGDEFEYYRQGVTPIIGAMIEKIDRERKQVCDRIGCRYISVQEWLQTEYGAPEGASLYDCIRNVEAYKGILAPKTMQHRYIYDDVTTGLAPIYYTGRKLGLEMTATEATIRFVSQLMNFDFINQGRKFREGLLKQSQTKTE